MAERDYRVKYTAVANFGKFLQSLKNVEKRLDALNDKTVKGTKKATDAQEDQTDAVKETTAARQKDSKVAKRTASAVSSAEAKAAAAKKRSDKEALAAQKRLGKETFQWIQRLNRAKIAADKENTARQTRSYRDDLSRQKSLGGETFRQINRISKAWNAAYKEKEVRESRAYKESLSKQEKLGKETLQQISRINKAWDAAYKENAVRETRAHKNIKDNLDEQLVGYKRLADVFNKQISGKDSSALGRIDGGSGDLITEVKKAESGLQTFMDTLDAVRGKLSPTQVNAYRDSMHNLSLEFGSNAKNFDSHAHELASNAAAMAESNRQADEASKKGTRVQRTYSKLTGVMKAVGGSFYQVKAAFLGLGIATVAFSLQSIVSLLAAAGGAAVVFANALAQLGGVIATVPGGILAVAAAAGGVALAFRGVGKAFSLFGKENGSPVPKTYAEALAQMAPAARKVVGALTDLYPAWQKVQKAAQKSFFGPIVPQVGKFKTILSSLKPILSSAAGAVGKVAAKGVEMMASGPWQDSFARLGKSNVKVIGSLGDALLSVMDAFRLIADAARPLTKFVGQTIAGLADDFRDWSASLNENSFDTVGTRLTQFISIIKSFGSIISSVFKAAGDTTDWLMQRFDAVAKGWAVTVKGASQEGGKLNKFFDDLKPVLSEVGKLFGDIFRGLASMVDLGALTTSIGVIRTELLPAVFELMRVLGQPENMDKFIRAIASIASIFAKLIDSGVLTFVTSLITVFDVLATILNTLASIPVIGQFVKLAGTVAGLVGAGIIVIGIYDKFVTRLVRLGAAAKKAAVAVGLLKTVETVGDAGGLAAGKGGKFSKFLAGIPALAGTAAGTVGAIAAGIAAVAAAITVGAVKLNDWYTANEINAKSSSQWSDELKQNAKDLQVVSKMKPPTQSTVPSGSNQAAPTTTTRFEPGTTADDIAAYDRAQKFKAELQDALRVGDEGLKRLDSVLTSFGSSLDSEGFATFVDNVKALGLNTEQAAEKMPQLTSFLAQYGTNLEQFKTDPFTQARVGAQKFFDTLAKGTANAAVVEQAQARLSASQAKFNTAVAKGKYEQQAFYSTNAQGIPVLGAFGQAVTTQAQGIEKFYQQLLSSGVSADVAKAKYGQMTAQLYASLPAWAQNATEGQKLISVMKSASNTPIEIQIHEGKLRNTIADIDAQINRLSRKKATPEATLKIDELTAKKAQAEKELHDLEANEVDPNVKPKSLEEADEIISKLQKDKEILSQTTLVSVDGSAISTIESQLLNAISLKAQLSSGGGGRASGGETSATKVAGANGGIVPGQGDTDSVQALLMPGEFVIRKSAAKAIGYDNLEKLNQTNSKGDSGFRKRRTRYATGGIVGLAQRFEKGGRAAKSPSDLAFEAGYAIALNEAKARAKYSKMKPAQQRAYDAREAGNEARTNREEALRRRDRELENQRRSIRDQIRAQQALVEAQEQARVAIEDMGKTVAQHNSGFTQRQASSELNSAKQNAKRVLADSNSTAVDREAARVELEAAQLRYDESLKQIEKDKADYAKLTAAGIEGSDGVIAARDSLTDFGFSLQDLAVSLREINAMIPTAEGGTLATPKGKAKKKSKPKGKRAMGGLIEGMQPYLVGEYGPEIVLPAERGRVMTHAQTQKLVSPQFSFNPLPITPKLSVPDAPRVKSTNVTHDSSRRFTIENQNINVHNPYRERSTDSIQRQLKKMTSREY